MLHVCGVQCVPLLQYADKNIWTELNVIVLSDQKYTSHSNMIDDILLINRNINISIIIISKCKKAPFSYCKMLLTAVKADFYMLSN